MSSKVVERSFDQPDGYVDVTFDYTAITGDPPPGDTYSQEIARIRRGFYKGVKTLNYNSRKAAGELLPLNSYMRFDFKEDRPHGTYGGTYYRPSPLRIYKYHVNSVRAVEGCTSTAPDASRIATEMLAGVNIEALLQRAVAGINPDLDVLTTSAEFGKTLRLILQAHRRARTLIQKGLRGGIRSAAKAVGDTWLEWRYGWRILGYDIAAVSEALSYPVRGVILSNREGEAKTSVHTNLSTFTGYYVSHSKISEISRDASVRAKAVAQFDLKSVNAFGDPFVTAWELIPFSFVADWFVSVGDQLQAWRVVRNASRIYASVGYQYKETGRLSIANVTVGTGTYATSPYATGTASSETLFRSRVPAGISLIPQVNLRLDLPKVLDLAALLSKSIL